MTKSDEYDIEDLAIALHKSELAEQNRPYKDYWEMSEVGRAPWLRIAERAFRFTSERAEEAMRLAYKHGYCEAYEDCTGSADHNAAEEGWQQYRERAQVGRNPKGGDAKQAPGDSLSDAVVSEANDAPKDGSA